MTNARLPNRFSLGGPRGASRAYPNRAGTRLLVALLALALLASGILAYQAHDASGSHEEVAQQAVTDLAHAAAWQLAERGEMELGRRLRGSMIEMFGQQPLRRGNGPSTLAGYVEWLENWEGCGCPAEEAVQLPDPDVNGVFRLPLEPERDAPLAGRGGEVDGAADEGEDGFRRVGALEVHGDALDDATGHWLADTLGVLAHAARNAEGEEALDHPPLGILLGPGDTDHAFLHFQVGAPDGGAAVYGYRVDASALARNTLLPLLAANDLLPRSVTGGLPQDSLFHLEAQTDGRALFRFVDGAADGEIEGASPPEGVATASETFPHWLGGMEVIASVPEERAESVVLGGLPSSRLPVILLLLALTGGLLAMAVVLLRREYQLAQLRSDFVAGVTHELRTPLSQIRMFAELLSAGTLTSLEERRRAVGIIDQESRRLDHLVDNVLGFARMSGTAGESVSLAPVDVDELLEEVLERFRPLAEAAGVRLEVDVEPGLRAQADRDAVHRIVLNLLDNAVKYGPAGQTVRVEAAREEDRVRVRVDDEGPGVPAGKRERIWRPYERLSSGSPRGGSATGSGIGLALVRRLTEAQRGTVDVADAPGGGARFEVRLPVASGTRAAA